MITAFVVSVVVVGVALGFWFQGKLRDKGRL
jgi:small-conductance mechanosensitive channel